MIQYLVRRLLWLPLLLAIVIGITFALGLYGPGDPVKILLGKHADPEAVARIRRELGLDRPFIVQYVDYLGRLARADFGESIRYRRPVKDLLWSRLKITIQLNAAALVLGVVIGIPLGILAAIRYHTWLDYLIVSVALVGISVPTFVIAPIVLWFFAVQVRVLPPGGWEGLFAKNAILPVAVLATGPIAVFVRQTRANMLEVLEQDYVRTARSKGLSERMVVLGHALRNALIPLTTIFGLMVGSLVGGTLFVELIFGIPGVGQLAFQAFFARDYPVIMAFTVLVAVSFTLANLLVDVSYAIIDPRIRYGQPS
jgi:peptide/nickel transport system permease protein